ncbi:MAG: glycosyltransferase [Cytophagaceae bacterium]
MKKLSIIIVNYNVRHFLEQTLRSVSHAIKNIETEVFVVDNNSVDGSVEMVRSNFPWVRLIENKTNTGFSKANNQAILQSSGEYILLLNPDTIVQEDTFLQCYQFMDKHPKAGGLGVKMLDGKGKFLPESKRGLPSPEVAFYKIFGLSALFPKSKRFGKYHLGFLDQDQTHEVEILSGAYMFLRKSVLDKVGLLDEEYFMYGEDIDLSYRILKAGYKNYYFPETRIIHYKGESTKKTSINYVFIFYKAMIIFAKKYFSSKNAKTFSFLINAAIYFRAFLSLCKRFIDKATLPALDVITIFGGIFLLKNFWESTYKHQNDYYPTEFIALVVPAYILVWLLSVKFLGGYKKPVSLFRVLQGIIMGTILISAISNFAEEYRYSRALILLGGAFSFVSMAGIRILLHFTKYRNFNLGIEKKKIILIGRKEESHRIINRIREVQLNLDIAGYVNPESKEYHDELCLGTLDQMQEIVEINKVNEIIFCSKDIPAHQIIEWMSKIDIRNMDYKIVPGDSNYVIGSSSKNKQGDFYKLNIELNILDKENIRNKRLLDVSFSIVLIVLSPIIMWFYKKPLRFVHNTFAVFSGKYSWVGYAENGYDNLPKIKKGIISPATLLPTHKRDLKTVVNLNLNYAKNYKTFTDLLLILRSVRKLGV